VKEIFKRAQALQKSNPGAKEADRIKAKLSGINSQTEALTERLSELPKGVPATPIYKQMEKLEGLRAEFSSMLEKINSLKPSRTASAVAKWETFEQFSKTYRLMLIQGLDSDQKRTVLQKFIRKVEVGTDSLKIHFMVDENHYRDELAHGKRELAPYATGRVAKSDFSTFVGSNSLTIGTRDRT
jgi:hypothetical protein